MYQNKILKYVRKADSFIKKSIDLYGLKLKEGCESISLQDTIIISGLPRGGTTWLMEIMATLSPSYKTLFEPLNRQYFPEVKKLGLPPRPYIPLEEESLIEDYFRQIFTGKVVSHYPVYSLSPKYIYRRLAFNKLIVKFVRANGILPWIAKNFRVRGIYFLIRHPCATISSQLESDAIPHPLTKDIVLRDASQIPQIGENEKLMEKLKTITTREEFLSAIWSMSNYIPLSSTKPYPWHTVAYEKLITDWKKEIKRIFGYIGEKTPERAYSMFKKPSKTTKDFSYVGTKNQLEKWKKKLSKRQIEKILRVTHWFGLDFYTEEPEPDYEALKHWKTPF